MQRVPPEADALQRAGAEILDEHIGLRHRLPQQRGVVRDLQVQRDAALVAVPQGEGLAAAFDEGWHAPRLVAVRALHLDDLGTHVAEHHRAVRTGQGRRQVEDEKAIQRRGRTHSGWIPASVAMRVISVRWAGTKRAKSGRGR